MLYLNLLLKKYFCHLLHVGVHWDWEHFLFFFLIALLLLIFVRIMKRCFVKIVGKIN